MPTSFLGRIRRRRIPMCSLSTRTKLSSAIWKSTVPSGTYFSHAQTAPRTDLDFVIGVIMMITSQRCGPTRLSTTRTTPGSLVLKTPTSKKPSMSGSRESLHINNVSFISDLMCLCSFEFPPSQFQKSMTKHIGCAACH